MGGHIRRPSTRLRGRRLGVIRLTLDPCKIGLCEFGMKPRVWGIRPYLFPINKNVYMNHDSNSGSLQSLWFLPRVGVRTNRTRANPWESQSKSGVGETSPVDLAQLAEEDKDRHHEGRAALWHRAEVNFNLNNSEAGPGGRPSVWRQWKGEGASLSFYLEGFQVPKGGELFVQRQPHDSRWLTT